MAHRTIYNIDKFHSKLVCTCVGLTQAHPNNTYMHPYTHNIHTRIHMSKRCSL